MPRQRSHYKIWPARSRIFTPRIVQLQYEGIPNHVAKTPPVWSGVRPCASDFDLILGARRGWLKAECTPNLSEGCVKGKIRRPSVCINHSQGEGLPSPPPPFRPGPPQISGASFNQPFRGLPVLQPTLPRIPDGAPTSGFRACHVRRFFY